MARLRGISQLALAHLFYDNATHTRFQHSAGASWRAGFFVRSLPYEEKEDIKPETLFRLKAAAMLHDIGHSAWSHVGERYAGYRGQKLDHDDVSCRLVLDENGEYDEHLRPWGDRRVRAVLTPEQRQWIASVIQGKSPDGDPRNLWMGQLVHGQLDVDRADYLSRDAFFTLSTTQMLIDPLTAATKAGIIDRGTSRELGFLDLSFAESFILARELMYQAVYMEPRKLVAEELLIRALLRGLPNIKLEEFWLSTDAQVLEWLARSEDVLVKDCLALMRQRISGRETYRVADIVRLDQEAPLTRDNAAFLNKNRQMLLEVERLVASEAGVPVDRFVMVVDFWREPKGLGRVWLKRDGGDPSQLRDKSMLLKTLFESQYGLSRSKVVVATHPDLGETDQERVRVEATTLLREVDLREELETESAEP